MRVATLYNGVRLVGRPCPANVERLDMGAMPLILDMQRNGVLIDQGHFRGLHKRLLARLAEIDADLEQQSEGWRPRKGQPLNFGSPDQVAELLYDHLRVHRDRPSAVKLTSGGKLSTGDEFLSLFKRVHPCVGLILERRQVTKLVSTYVLPLPKMAAEQGGRVHTEFVSTRTATGRYSSRNPNCFSADTEILTTRGWVAFPRLRPSDLVAQWWKGESISGTISFVAPTAYQKLEGRTIRISNQHIDLKVTGDHRCLLLKRGGGGGPVVVSASEYPEDHKQLGAGWWPSGASRGLPIKDDMLRLLVAIQADGHWVVGSGRRRVDMGFRKERKASRLRGLLIALRLPYRESSNAERFRFYFDAPEVFDYIGPSKEFGPWLLEMSRRQVDVFLGEIMFWDGCWTRKNHYSSNLKSNADWVQALFVLSGKRANLRKYVNSAGCVNWQVDVTDRDYTWTTNVKRSKPGDDVETVYCVSVPSSFVVVRRNGKVMITGQCQNIPARSSLGLEVRNGFIASPGYSLVSHDLSQIEMRLAGSLSGDSVMCGIFARDLDIHNITAIEIFRLDAAWIDYLAGQDRAGALTPEEATAWKQFKHQMRLPCKTLGFGILYGVTPEGLQLQIAAADGPWWETAECERLINQWYEVYSGIRAYMDRQHQQARRYRMAWDMFGRARGIPEVRAASQSVVNAGLRMTGNHGIQAGAAGILKLAMAWVRRELIPMFPEGAVRPLLTVHDELIAEVRNDCVADYLEAGKYPMEGLVPLPNGVRIVSSADSAERWGELK